MPKRRRRNIMSSCKNPNCNVRFEMNSLAQHLRLHPHCREAYFPKDHAQATTEAKLTAMDDAIYKTEMRLKVFQLVGELYWFRCLGGALIKWLMCAFMGLIALALTMVSR
jgi:hypothetical protein